MTDFTIHNEETAPDAGGDMLGEAKDKFGMVPNVLGIMAESSSELEGYLTLSKLFEETSLTQEEQKIVLMTVSFENECDYCMAAHSMESENIGVSEKVISAVRNGEPIEDNHLEALRRFTAAVVRKRGNLVESDVETFLEAGYEQKNILEVILAVGMKTMSNYTNHIANTPLDEAMESYRWEPPQNTDD